MAHSWNCCFIFKLTPFSRGCGFSSSAFPPSPGLFVILYPAGKMPALPRRSADRSTMPAVRPKPFRNLKMGHHQLYRQLCADKQLEYDARHASAFGCNDFVASILKTFARTPRRSEPGKGEPCRKSAGLASRPKRMLNGA